MPDIPTIHPGEPFYLAVGPGPIPVMIVNASVNSAMPRYTGDSISDFLPPRLNIILHCTEVPEGMMLTIKDTPTPKPSLARKSRWKKLDLEK